CGAEGFRKAFLPYKSKELARLAPQINNESSHNSYLDAAISFGLVGVALYVAVLASMLSLLFSCHKLAISGRSRLILSGIFSSMIGVVVHNFFIFDQIPTGLYFFAFAALAQIASNTISREIQPASAGRETPKGRKGKPMSENPVTGR